jgi:hypothetical protein
MLATTGQDLIDQLPVAIPRFAGVLESNLWSVHVFVLEFPTPSRELEGEAQAELVEKRVVDIVAVRLVDVLDEVLRAGEWNGIIPLPNAARYPEMAVDCIARTVIHREMRRSLFWPRPTPSMKDFDEMRCIRSSGLHTNGSVRSRPSGVVKCTAYSGDFFERNGKQGVWATPS